MSSRRNNSLLIRWPQRGRLALGLGINVVGLVLLIGHGIGAG